MKKVLSLVLAIAVLATLCLAFASCGKKLSGTYVDNITGFTSYEFKGDKVTVTYDGLVMKSSYEGTYKIEKDDDGDLKITFTFEGDGSQEYSGTFDFEEIDKKTIKIGILTYKKK